MDEIAAIAERNLSIEREFATEFSEEIRARPGLSNDKGSLGADIHYIKGAQFFGEQTWAKPSMPSNIDASEKYDQSHSVCRDTNITSIVETATAKRDTRFFAHYFGAADSCVSSSSLAPSTSTAEPGTKS